jgi:hypothetical protein
MATAVQSPAYTVIEASVVVQRVTHHDGALTAQVRTSGWVQIDGTVYGWETAAQDIPLQRIAE